MALKAGYVGIKSQLMRSLRDKLLKLDGIIPAGASSDNPLATESEIVAITEQLTPIYTSASAASNLVTFPDEFFKSVVKVGKTVFFNVRFTTSDVTPTSVVPLVNIGYAPDASYPLFTLRKRLQPYDEVCGLYMGVSGELSAYGIELPAGDYWVTGTYICKESTAALTRTAEDPAEEPAATTKTTRSKKTKEE